MNHSEVVSIFITETAGAPMRLVSEVKAVSGKGLEGDRYFDGDGTFSRKSGPDREVTLIELEAVKALERDYQLSVTSGATPATSSSRRATPGLSVRAWPGSMRPSPLSAAYRARW